jgi:hypothetical protein
MTGGFTTRRHSDVIYDLVFVSLYLDKLWYSPPLSPYPSTASWHCLTSWLSNYISIIFHVFKCKYAALGGLVVSVLATGPRGCSVAGSNPTEGGWFSFGGEVKPSAPWRRFTACKRTLHSMSEMLCRPNFLTSFSPVIFSCSGCWIRLIRNGVVAAG